MQMQAEPVAAEYTKKQAISNPAVSPKQSVEETKDGDLNLNFKSLAESLGARQKQKKRKRKDSPHDRVINDERRDKH